MPTEYFPWPTPRPGRNRLAQGIKAPWLRPAIRVSRSLFDPEVWMDEFASASVNGAGSGGGAGPAFFSVSFVMLISILVARESAPADLLTS
jgi:hypothetical protein